MRNPFKKQVEVDYTELELDDLINSLLTSVSLLIRDIEELRADLEDLTDFVEERLD